MSGLYSEHFSEVLSNRDFSSFRAQQMFDEVLEGLEEEPWRIRYDIYRNYATFCQYHTNNIDLAFTYYKKVLIRSTLFCSTVRTDRTS